jgi:DNA-binding transcriptional MerR regulator
MVVSTRSKSKKVLAVGAKKAASDHYSVKTICQLTGLNEHTLRAWERRYQIVQPARGESGRRIYSIEDLEKLKLVTLLVRKGFLIGNIATNSLSELNELLSDTSAIPQEDAGQLDRNNEYIKLLRGAIDAYDLTGLQSFLQQARVEYGIRPFLLEIVLPFMRIIGDAVDRGECTIGQEHAWSAIVKSELMQLLYLFSRTHAHQRDSRGPKTFAVATNEGNQHEFGALISAVLCAFHGYPTYFFGPNMPAKAIAEAAAAVGANCILLGLPTALQMKAEVIDAFIGELREAMPKVCELWVGGQMSDAIHADRSIRKIHSLVDLEQLLTMIKKV